MATSSSEPSVEKTGRRRHILSPSEVSSFPCLEAALGRQKQEFHLHGEFEAILGLHESMSLKEEVGANSRLIVQIFRNGL